MGQTGLRAVKQLQHHEFRHIGDALLPRRVDALCQTARTLGDQPCGFPQKRFRAGIAVMLTLHGIKFGSSTNPPSGRLSRIVAMRLQAAGNPLPRLSDFR